jgi:hypothetical protein
MQNTGELEETLVLMAGTLIMIFILRFPSRRFVMPLSSSEIRAKCG